MILNTPLANYKHAHQHRFVDIWPVDFINRLLPFLDTNNQDRKKKSLPSFKEIITVVHVRIN